MGLFYSLMKLQKPTFSGYLIDAFQYKIHQVIALIKQMVYIINDNTQ